MSYIEFNKKQLINLKYSLDRELLRTNRAGGYASSTIIHTNTRKYHGLLVVRQPLIDDLNHVLLSTLDETLTVNNFDFHLSMRMYEGGNYDPKGHKYIRDFVSEPNLKLVYRLGNTIFTKESIFAEKENRILIRYTVEDTQEDFVNLKVKPFLAYRNVHSLSKANTWVETKFNEIKNGASWQMYKGYSKVNMQFSKNVKYTHVPDWYYNIQYIREMERGYESLEDLFVPGYFDVKLKKGESVVVSAGLEEKTPSTFKRQFNAEVKKRTPRDSFENCLNNAADEFFVSIDKNREIIAGYPWFGRWGRDTFISLPGLALSRGKTSLFKEVMKTMIAELKDGLFPNVGMGKDVSYNSVDASLWFFWAIQKYAETQRNKAEVWQEYSKPMKSILSHFAKGTHNNIMMHDNGLVWQGIPGKALTWMDAIVHGKAVTPRIGYAVEINALWYNAIAFSLEIAKEANDKAFVNKWGKWPDIIKDSFETTFWDPQKRYLADYVNGDYKNWDVRPNMIFAASLPYSVLSENKQRGVLDKVKTDLLTPKGLRTLSPKNKDYKAINTGDQSKRDASYHQGVVWPWLLGAFADTYIRLQGEKGMSFINDLYHGFEKEMSRNGIGTVSEIYDGDPPYEARGAISQAWSVAELLRINKMIK
ncbi:MAG: amylo-alpha-1,6-glucosidase [Marinilabiliales bacterium]|nr:MAG: amylo-alpha-1,6-glucosidase [Marinilabiliales bacterium]